MKAVTAQLVRNPYHDNRWRWYVTASNGKTLARSEQDYAKRADAIRSLELVTGGEFHEEEWEQENGVRWVTEEARLERGELRPIWVRESR